MPLLKLENVDKIYKNSDVKSVDNVTLEIAKGEFVALLGPSGCGKTTTLRMIAGLEDITAGNIYLEDKLANDMRPDKRNIGMVFQDYALIPHFTVRDNIGYPLKIAKKSKAEIKEVVDDLIDKVSLEKYQNKKPGKLSGGQRQRVALARALAKDCELVLMDEPLSNLDVALRASARSDIMKINKDLGKTIVYVTHDQIEAMTMADKIMVLNLGQVQQIGTSKEIYQKPANTFVAKFIGNPGMNIFELNKQTESIWNLDDLTSLDSYFIGIRPEHCVLSTDLDAANYIGKLVNLEDYGNDLILELKNEQGKLRVRTPNLIEVQLGEEYAIKFIKNNINIFDSEGVRYEE